MHARSVVLPLLLLLAGCAEPGGEDPDGGPGPDGPGPGTPGFAPQRHHAEDARDGLRAEGDLYECGGGFCVDARAANEGDRTYHVSSICVPPWSDAMARDGAAVQHREPMAHCAAFGTEPMAPGDDREVNVTWDGRLWDDAEGRLEPAPQGAYVWSLTFHAYGEADGGGPVSLVLEFPVVVGPT